LYYKNKILVNSSYHNSTRLYFFGKKNFGNIIKTDLYGNIVMENSITCKTCSKIYKSAVTYNKHITLNRCKINDNTLHCKHCHSTFKNKYIRKTHETRCVDIIGKLVDKKIAEMGLVKPEGQILVTQNVNNNITNINNSQNIIINNFGNEDISHLSKNQILKALRMNKGCPVELVKLIHFNKEKPENHNIYKPNFKDKYVKYCENNIWKIGDLMKIVTELYLSKMDIAEEKFEELKQFLEDSKKDRFQELLDNREEPEIMCEILKRIIEILYNERSVVTDKVK